jgi:hypothetical protein
MKLEQALSLIKDFGVCRNCGDDDVTVQISKHGFTRTCKCGFKVELNMGAISAPPEGITEKKCSRCKHTLPLGLFGNNKRSKDGKSSMCKECTTEYSRDWHHKNAEQVNSKRRESETKKEYDKNYFQEHKDEIYERRKQTS